MPYAKKSFRRKTLSRSGKRRLRRKTVLVNRALQPVAQRYITKMKYCETYAPVNASGQAVWRLNLNSIFDPNRTGTGHQPYGHDNFAAMYNRYRVIAASYVVSAVSNNNTTLQIAAIPTNEEFVGNAISEYRENPRCKFGVQTPGGPMKVLKGKVYLPSLTGRNKAQYMADDRYQAQFGASPSELMVLNLCTQAFDETLLTSTQTVFQVCITYTVELFDPVKMSQS